MPHSYTSCLVHYVFSTKDRRKLISSDLQERLWPYLGGIARENEMKALAVGGMDDHVHLLVSLPSTLSVAKCIQLIKGGSSKWIHDTFSEHRSFAWQEGYGGFTVSKSAVPAVEAYIAGQKEHHKRQDFMTEFSELLRLHGVEFDPHDVFR